jgi:quercetin dioxygenase-like cupin family protein
LFGATIDDEALLTSPELVFGGPVVGSQERMRVQILVNDERGIIGYESFAAGDTVHWAFFHNEAHVITRGEAEVTYTLGPNFRKEVTKTFRAGDTYLIPNGARVRWKVGPDEPYLHICMIMPRFQYTKDERLETYQ